MKISTTPSFAPVSFTCETPEELKVMLALFGSISEHQRSHDILNDMTVSEIGIIHDDFVSNDEWNRLAATVGFGDGEPDEQ